MKDETRGRIARITILAVGAAFLLPITLFIIEPFRTHRMRVRLLCRTDHQALLEGGRELLRQASQGQLEYRGYAVRGFRRAPEVSRFPRAILKLAPSAVVVHSDGFLQMEMHGGMDYFGVLVYPADFNEVHPDLNYGDCRIMDGLWYYDNVCDRDPAYDRWVEDTIKKSLTTKRSP